MEDFIAESSKDAARVSISVMPSFRANYITDADRKRAAELMHQQRVQDKKEKKSKKSEPFTWKEANPVLATIIADKKNPASPGLVQALLEDGANVSIAVQKSKSFFKKVIRSDQKEQRSDLLAQATRNCGAEVVWLLTQSADETARSEALPFAIRQNDPTKAQILIVAGTDARPLCTEFITAVENQWEQMVQVLLASATKGACQTCRNRGLVKATQKGSMAISQMLLDKGGDADFESGAAIQKALEDGREDLVIAITSCAKRPSPKSLDIAVETAYVKLEKDAEKQHRMIETCLKTGAKGSKTDETLVQVCKKGQTQLIDILLAHGASVDHNSGASLQFAITSKQPELLTTLLQGKPSNSTMAAVIPYTMTLEDLKETHTLIDILLSAGLRGDSVAETLIKAIETGIPGGSDSGHLEMVQLLLEKGEANVNLQGGRSILLAVSQGRVNVLALLLQHTPSVDSLNAAFPHAIDITDSSQRLKIATMLLEAGAKGKVIDEALVASAKTGKDGASLTSAILNQSSVDFDGGKPLTNAVNSRCLEQMKALMVGIPSASTITAAWTEADAIEDDDFQLKAFEVLLTSSVDISLQDNSLVAAAKRGQRGLPICSLLLQNQASPERLDAAALVAAAKGLHLDTLSLLAKFVTLPAAFHTTFDAFSDGEQWLQPRGLEIVHFILEHGASGPEVDATFCKAARLYEADALELLATSINPEVVNVALVLVTQSTDDWLSTDNRNLWLIHSLLEWGAQGESVNVAFLKAVDAYSQGHASEELIDTFLTVGSKADVNFQSGAALQIAIRYGNPLLLKKLAAHGATQEIITLAFAETIIAVLEEEDVVLSLIDVLSKNKEVKPDYKTPPDGYQPALFACLAAHPKSAKLVERLIKLGCDTEAQVDTFLYDDEELDSEPATVLAWALSQGTFIDSVAINALIDGKANINFVAKISKATPLILAAKNSRGDIVSKLLRGKANTTARDQFDRSALFYASRIGDLEAVTALVKAKAPTNDGSLQEAARNLHSEVVAVLIKGKHSPNFPSSKEQHQGRTALQEMALMCDASNNLAAVETTILALIKGKPKILEKVREKNALFLALDNAHPVPITKALLDSLMWEYINQVDNVYVEVDPELGTKYYFSPTTYVSRGFSQGPESDNTMLLNLLRDKRCEDRYYAEEGAEQPEGATGMPKHIIDAEKKRKDHEEKLRKKEMEHQIKLLHSKQEAELKDEIDRSRHEEKIFREDEAAQQKLDLKDQMHQQQLIQEAEKAAQKQGIMNSTNDLKISMQQKADESKLRAQKARAEFEEVQKVRMSQLKALATKQEQDLKLEFTRKANAQKLALQERQSRLAAAASERKLLTAQRMAETHAAEAKHKLDIKEKQDQLALKMMKGTAKQKRESHNMKMKEVQAQSETMKLKMLDKYFASQPKNLKRITAS
ncbi:hypothetical protein TWF281_003027 [Arthrobotrys megalospora]